LHLALRKELYIFCILSESHGRFKEPTVLPTRIQAKTCKLMDSVSCQGTQLA
jgi:hypothetical protein